jgi:hypothetical protein
MASKQKPLTIGDRVAFSVQWLKSIGCSHGELPAMRGTLIAIETPKGFSFAIHRVLWDGDTELKGSRRECLAKVGPNREFANCD